MKITIPAERGKRAVETSIKIAAMLEKEGVGIPVTVLVVALGAAMATMFDMLGSVEAGEIWERFLRAPAAAARANGVDIKGGDRIAEKAIEIVNTGRLDVDEALVAIYLTMVVMVANIAGPQSKEVSDLDRAFGTATAAAGRAESAGANWN